MARKVEGLELQCSRVLKNAESRRLPTGRRPRLAASMQPRSEERGEFAVVLKQALQRGLLQCSRVLKNAERRRADDCGSAPRAASMQPRSEERGEVDERARRRGAAHASMQPRSEERGEAAVRTVSECMRIRLQCSRVLKNAERLVGKTFFAPLLSFNAAAF